MTDPIKQRPSRRYRAVHSSGKRRPSDVTFVVIHGGECSSDEGIASWFTNPASGGSTQYAVDDDSAYQTLEDMEVCWGAPPLNLSGVHIEIAGFAHWSRRQWLMHLPSIKRAAWITAQECVRYGIPARWLSWEQARTAGTTPGHGRGGIVSHANVSKGWRLSDHTDPGRGFPVSTFMWFVRRYVRAIERKR